jgi:hypothetical protein
VKGRGKIDGIDGRRTGSPRPATDVDMSAKSTWAAAPFVLLTSMALGNVGCDGDANGTSSGSGDGGAGSGAGSGGGAGDGGSVAITPSCGGPAEGESPISTKLPSIPGLRNVRACTHGDAVNVTFDPLDDAGDYRIYPLPKDGDITTSADGSVVVANAIYRCAGHREALYMLVDQPEVNDNSAGGATVLNGVVEGFTRAEADATLGYVFNTPGPGRVPVYVLAVGEPGLEGGYTCGRPIFASTRPKVYTTDKNERDRLIADNARDDGIAFYVPESAGAGTRAVYEGTFGDGDVLRWIDGPEAGARGTGARVFDVLSSQEQGSVPLFRVHVAPYCNKQHDALVAGTARLTKIRSEGDHVLPALRWSGITEDTVLVVEALDGGCPYQGSLSTEHKDAFQETFGSEILEYEAFLTLEDMRQASPTGEVFVNGQFDDAPMPKAIARTFLNVAPNPPEDLDFYTTFPEKEDFRSKFGEPTGNVYGLHFTSPDYTFSSYNNSNVFFGTMLGEFWVSYNDIAADVNGKWRLTPNQKATLSADSYLHVTTEVDIISTGRRYPQIIISDQVAPVQDNLTQGTTLIVQPKDYTPTFLQVQICDHRNWDVNDQCPMLPTFASDIPQNSQLPGELAGTDNAIKLDIYLSTQRIYLLIDDKPYACTELPGKADDGNVYHPPSGPVTVTWGDVLYHSAVDFATGGGDIQGDSYLFHRTHMHKTGRRHFDNLGFASGSPRPAWDESKIPCVSSQ